MSFPKVRSVLSIGQDPTHAVAHILGNLPQKNRVMCMVHGGKCIHWNVTRRRPCRTWTGPFPSKKAHSPWGCSEVRGQMYPVPSWPTKATADISVEKCMNVSSGPPQDVVMFLKSNGNRQTVVQSQNNRKMLPFDLLCCLFFSFHHFPNSFVLDVLLPGVSILRCVPGKMWPN